jgi:hypothetical protein
MSVRTQVYAKLIVSSIVACFDPITSKDRPYIDFLSKRIDGLSLSLINDQVIIEFFHIFAVQIIAHTLIGLNCTCAHDGKEAKTRTMKNGVFWF